MCGGGHAAQHAAHSMCRSTRRGLVLVRRVWALREGWPGCGMASHLWTRRLPFKPPPLMSRQAALATWARHSGILCRFTAASRLLRAVAVPLHRHLQG